MTSPDIFSSTQILISELKEFGICNGSYEHPLQMRWVELNNQLRGRLSVFQAWLSNSDFDSQIELEQKISNAIKSIQEALQ
jgi:hypothetical protein